MPFDHSSYEIDNSALFQERDYDYTIFNTDLRFHTSPAIIHMFVFTVFIAFFAPFGGFFVSGLKQALKHKQLGLTLHKGGVIDRLDCVIILGFFMLVYVHGFVYRQDQSKVEKAQALVR